MNVKLTGLKFCEMDDVADVLNEKSLLKLVEVNHPAKPNACAYAVEWGGKHIAWLPEVESVRGYYKDALCQAEQARIAEWGNNLKAMRADLEADWANKARVWMVGVAHLRRNSMGKITEISIKWGK